MGEYEGLASPSGDGLSQQAAEPEVSALRASIPDAGDAQGWVARDLPGGIYCAPRCGYRCTREDYEIAVRRGAELAKHLGHGWEPRIWENFGWHYDASKGVCHVSPNIDRCAERIEDGGFPVRSFTVFFNSGRQVLASALTAEDALGFAVQDARTLICRLSDDLAALLDDAQGIEARSDETRSGSAEGESPVGNADAPNTSPEPTP